MTLTAITRNQTSLPPLSLLPFRTHHRDKENLQGLVRLRYLIFTSNGRGNPVCENVAFTAAVFAVLPHVALDGRDQFGRVVENEEQDYMAGGKTLEELRLE